MAEIKKMIDLRDSYLRFEPLRSICTPIRIRMCSNASFYEISPNPSSRPDMMFMH